MLSASNPMSFQHYMLGLFAVANNFPALGLFLSICQDRSRKDQLKLSRIATLTAFLTMAIALVSGQMILEFFEISIEAFKIAGGILLCVSGMAMLNSKPTQVEQHSENDFSKVISVAIIPIGIPLTTGGGTISTVILFSGKLTDWPVTIRLSCAILVMTVLIYLIFRYSTNLLHFLGNVGMNALIRIMGLFTLAIGVQFILDGVSKFFPGLMGTM